MPRHTFSFDAFLLRGKHEREIEVEVTYTIDDRDIQIVSVRHEGAEIETSQEETWSLEDYAADRAGEDLAEYYAEAADYRAEMRREDRWFHDDREAAE